MSSIFIIGLFITLLNVYSTPQPIATMGITTHALIFKDKATSRATIATAATPKEPQSKRLAKSPHTVNVNPHIAKINLPRAQFDIAREALRPATVIMHENTQDNDLNNPCGLEPPPEKANHITPLVSLTGIDHQPTEDSTTTNNNGTEESPRARVRISNATVTVDTNLMPAAPTTSRRSILQSASTGVSQGSNSLISDDNASQSKTHIKEVHDCTNMLFRVFSDNGMKETSYHVSDFAGLYPVWPIIEFSMAPTGAVKDKRMNSFTKCMTALLGEILYVEDTAKIATISITKDKLHYISSKADLPTYFTKLGQYIMISGGSWVFNKKEKGSNNVYARFRLKSQVDTEEIMNRVSFKFSCLGRKNLQKKQHQAMETETPLMLLFMCNGTDQASIISDTKQMLNTMLDDIEQNGMLPEEFKKRDILHFTLCLNVPRLPTKTKLMNNKGYDHYKEHGKKAFHFELAKEEINYFKYLSTHAHRMKLDVKYFGKFTRFTGTLENKAPLSNCTRLRRCIQGHLNYHLSLTSIMPNGTDMFDASEYLRNPANGKFIVRFTLRNLLYRITLENKAPLFLQLSQCQSGEVNVVIPNMAKAELMAERMNVQIAAWCHFYWKDLNPGAKRFYQKLSDRAFSQVLLHKNRRLHLGFQLEGCHLSKLPNRDVSHRRDQATRLSETFVAGQQREAANKGAVDLNVAFPFQDDFSVGTIHGTNVQASTPGIAAAPTATEVVEIQDDNKEVSVLTAKTTSKAQSNVAVGSRVASCSNPASGPTNASTQPKAASGGLEDPASNGLASGAVDGPKGK